MFWFIALKFSKWDWKWADILCGKKRAEYSFGTSAIWNPSETEEI